MDILMQHLTHGMWLSLLLSLPAVITAAIIGLVVGILQAVTQVQEQTIAAAPKILGVFLLMIFASGLMMNILGDYIRESFAIAFNEVPADGDFLAPPRTSDNPAVARRQSFYQQREPVSPVPGKVKSALAQPVNAAR